MEPTLEDLERRLRLGLVARLEEDLLALLEVLPETDSLLVGKTHLTLGKLHARMCQYEKALFHTHAALQLLKEASADPCYLVFSSICRGTGQLSKAQDWLKLCARIPTTEYCLEQGLVMREVGRYRDAEKELLQALDLTLRSFSPRDVQSVQCCHNLGVIYCVLGRYLESRSFLRSCMSTAESLCDQPNLLETEIWHDYAYLCLASGRLVEAEAYACKALYTRKLLLGQEALGLAKNYTLLGNIFLEEGKAPKAEKLLIKAIGILRMHQGAGADLDTGNAFLSLAYLYLGQMEIDHSLRNAERGYRLLKSVLPERHADRASALMLLALVLQAGGRTAEAKACWDAMLQNYGSSLPEEHPYVGKVLALSVAFKTTTQGADEKYLKELL